MSLYGSIQTKVSNSHPLLLHNYETLTSHLFAYITFNIQVGNCPDPADYAEQYADSFQIRRSSLSPSPIPGKMTNLFEGYYWEQRFTTTSFLEKEIYEIFRYQKCVFRIE